MTRTGKSKRASYGLRLSVAALATALLIPATAIGVDEYDLQLPSGGNEDSAPAPAAPAPVAPTPTYTEPAAPVPYVVPVEEKPKPKPVFGETSLNASVGPQRIPPLKVGPAEREIPALAIVLIALAGIACVFAVWRLRYLRELPAAPRPRTGSAAAATASGSAAISSAAARVRSRPPRTAPRTKPRLS